MNVTVLRKEVAAVGEVALQRGVGPQGEGVQGSVHVVGAVVVQIEGPGVKVAS